LKRLHRIPKVGISSRRRHGGRQLARFGGFKVEIRSAVPIPNWHKFWANASKPFVAAASNVRIRNPLLAISIVFISVSVFIFDTITPRPIGVVYVVALLIAGTSGRREWIIRTSILAVVFLLLSNFINQGDGPRCVVRITAILIVTGLTLRNTAASKRLIEQARLLDQTHDSISSYDLDGRITSWNKGAERLYGWSSEEAIQSISHDLLRTRFPRDRGLIVKDLAKRGSWSGELRNTSRDGRIIVVDSRWSLVRDDTGVPVSILETSNDITARKEADDATKQSEIRYRTIFETTGVSIWECDLSEIKQRISLSLANRTTDLTSFLRDNPEVVREAIRLMKVVDANEASVRLFGAETKTELFAALGTIWPPHSEQIFAEAMIASCTTRSRFQSEAALRTIDGRPLELAFSTAHPVSETENNTIFLSMVDITELKKAHAALHSLQIELANASRLSSLGALTASIAHEVNQPLAGILANGQAGLRWLRREHPEIDKAGLSFEKLIADAKRAGKIISGIQSLAKNQPPNKAILGLNDLIRDSLALLEGELNTAGVELSLDLADGPSNVYVERVQFQQVIVNLVLNAIQAMSDTHDGQRFIQVASFVERGCAVVTVLDTGPGIAPEIKDRLFMPFSTTKNGGMGLGLSICATIMARQDGRISADTNRNRGVMFKIELPAVQRT